MHYLDLKTGEYPVTLAKIRKTLNKTSLPAKPSNATLRRYGFCVVRQVPKPEGNNVVEGYPRLVEGEFQQTWVVDQNVSLAECQAALKERVVKAYRRCLASHKTIGGKCYPVTCGEEMTLVFLECLFLKDEDSKETVLLEDKEGDFEEMSWEDAMVVARTIITYRSFLKKEKRRLLSLIKDCGDIRDCRTLERQFNETGLFKC